MSEHVTLLLLPCPFCGFAPTVEKWHGSGRHSTLVGCENEACPSTPTVHGQSRKEAVLRWNTRVPSSQELTR